MRHAPLGIVIALGGFFFAHPGSAADLYLRGGVGVELGGSATFTDRDRSSTNPPALFGPVPGNDGREIAGRGDFGAGVAIDAAAGLRLTPFFRAELAASWKPSLDFTGQANFAGVAAEQPVSGEASSLSAMLALYTDLPALGPVRPFVGAGAGIAFNSLTEMTYAFPTISPLRRTVTPSGDNAAFAWMATAGMALPVNETLTVDLAYRYSDLGRVETDQGMGTVVTAGGAVIPLRLDSTRASLRSHGITLSVRRAF